MRRRRSRPRMPKATRRQDGQLMRRVDAVDVEARIGLGIAQALGLGQHVGEIAAGLAHRRQDVIAGAVQDAVDARRSRLAARPSRSAFDDRDAAGDGRLVAERHALGLGHAGQAPCHDGRAAPCWRSRQACRRAMAPDHQLACHAVGAADQLDDDVDLGSVGQSQRRRRTSERAESRSPRSRARESRAPTRRAISIRRPAAALDQVAAWALSSWMVPAPTVPSPAMAILRGGVK